MCACPGSWLAEQAYPNEGSAAAEAGTRLHAHMEHGTDPEDAEEAEAIEWCRTMESELAYEYVGSAGASREELREVRWWYKGLFSGQGDVCYRQGRTALVLDYKFGRVPVTEAKRNKQLAGLALLAFENLEGLEEVYVGILQPWVSRGVPQLVKFGRAALPHMRAYFEAVVKDAMTPGAPLRAGEHCKYCRASAACTVLRLQAERASGLELTHWANWDEAEKRKAWDVAQVAKKWAESVERKVRKDLTNGDAVSGLMLGAGKTSFTVTEPGLAYRLLRGELDGLDSEVFTGCCSVRMTDLDKAVHGYLKDRNPKQTTKASREWLRELLAGCGELKTTAGSIVEYGKGEA